jgi:2-keto-4-pentenoate hydratase/2-oxohepta-3-ene-1,7-dioic acid hydratase in catechol pathway
MYFSTAKFNNKLFIGCKIEDYLIHLAKAYQYFVQKAFPEWLEGMRSLLAQGESGIEKVKELKDEIRNILSTPEEYKRMLSEGIIHNIKDVQIMAPILDPGKIICIGLNYKDHCLEQNVPIPKSPILFSKFSTAIIGPEDKIVRPKLTEQLDFEGELAFIVGRKGRHIQVEQAMNYVAGYTIMNDVSARDIQFSDRQWLRGKTFDTFAPMGPFLVTKDEVKDPHNLDIKVKVNHKIMQQSNTKNMIHKIPYLVNFISQVVTLSPGDVVATGTPAGVGVFRKPPVFLKDGDEIVIEIERLGLLRNTVVDEKK